MLTLNQIHAAIQERLESLRPAVAEVDKLEKALAALEQAVAETPRRGRRKAAG